MRKAVRIIPVAACLALDVLFAVLAWSSGGANPAVFLAFHFIVLFALGVLYLRANREDRSGAGTLPKYWRTYLDSRLPGIREKDMLIGDHGDSFIYITDLHYNVNDGYSAAAAQYIMDRSAISKVVVGGDICNGSSRGKAVCLEQILNYRDAFRRINPYYVHGNHDNNTEISERSDEKTVSDSELYGMLLKPVEDRIVRGKDLRYCFHNEAQKIRYVCLDTGHPDSFVLEDEQIAWMQDRIRELPAGWTAVVLTHQFYNTDGTKDGNGVKILAGLRRGAGGGRRCGLRPQPRGFPGDLRKRIPGDLHDLRRTGRRRGRAETDRAYPYGTGLRRVPYRHGRPEDLRDARRRRFRPAGVVLSGRQTGSGAEPPEGKQRPTGRRPRAAGPGKEKERWTERC